jgi:carboxyl-terminal processing protease
MKTSGIIFLVVVAFAGRLAGAAPDPTVVEKAEAPAPAPAAGPALEPELNRVIEHLRQLGLNFDGATARQAAIQAIIQTADPLGRLLEADEARRIQQAQEGQAYQLGVRLTMTNGTPRIVEVLDHSAGRAADLAADDRLLRVNDVATLRTDLVTASGLLRQPEEAVVNLLVRKASGATNEVSATLRLGPLPVIETAELLTPKIAYLRLNGIFKGSARPVVELLKAWHAEERFGLILDLRGSGGSDLRSVVEISSLFGPASGHLFTLRDLHDQDIESFRAKPSLSLGLPTMVLVDEETTGAAEILAASLKRSVRGAMLLGAPTRGDPGIRELIDLDGRHYLYLATRRLVVEDGTVYDGLAGVLPDIRVTGRAAEEAVYEPELTPSRGRELIPEELEDRNLRLRLRGDPVLRRAVDILLGLKALDIRGFKYLDSSTR